MGDSEVADTESAVGLGCALESFAEVDEVKSKLNKTILNHFDK